MPRKPTSLIPRTHRELCEIAERWLMGTKRCRVAIAEPNCIITDERPDAIGFGGYASVLVEAKTSRADFLADLKKPFRIHPIEDPERGGRQGAREREGSRAGRSG